ncbi:unnamed protein product [Paramecium primaurelia]|uniref:Protein kinase domain-containing protein n=1 Tax=Paramecium primaurelia TaxID=5886 RepID=A0A8S1Q6S1_PARPR|nr:unnamed protein product [Paramecium primaurelia]
MYDFIAEQPPFFEINSFLVKDRITKQKQLLKRIYEKIQVPGDEFKIQVFLKKNPHPNILQYNSHYVEDRKQFISLDYYKQGTLKNIFNKFRNHIPLNIVRKIMEQLLNGLDHLHSNGIMHRDIQPENIIVTNFDEIQIKIANFTLSVFGEQFTRFCGKKCYAAPEVVNHFIHTNKCDIYSAGVVFYELLNCKQIQRHFDPQIACIELKKQGLNEQAVDLVTQMLDIDPIRRLNIDDCLSHKFFTDEESQVSNYKYLLNKNQVNPKLSQIYNC